jgi:3-oxoacyl-[acyl-carrier protein] reductase
MERRFDKQVALVTGGAQGLGYGIARRLGQEGATLALLDHNAEQLARARQTLTDEGITVDVLEADVCHRAAVHRAVETLHEQCGRIDVLITAAGVTGETNRRTHEVDPEDFDHVLDVNLRGMFLCIHAVLPHMLKAGYGRIVNIASISGKDGNAGMLAYSTSKAAVIGLTKVIGKEYAQDGITCNAVAPAVVRTALVDAMPAEQVRYMTDRIPMGRTGEIEEVAAVVAFAASREAGFTTGFTFDASGGRAVY